MTIAWDWIQIEFMGLWNVVDLSVCLMGNRFGDWLKDFEAGKLCHVNHFVPGIASRIRNSINHKLRHFSPIKSAQNSLAEWYDYDVTLLVIIKTFSLHHILLLCFSIVNICCVLCSTWLCLMKNNIVDFLLDQVYIETTV